MSGSSDQSTLDLVAAFGRLQSLLLTTSDVGSFLTELARLAAQVIDPPASVGITIRREDQLYTVANSDERAAQVDEVQYDQGEGPCLETLRTGRVIEVADLAADDRWEGYRQHALDFGVRSSLSLPLTVDHSVVGALNVYGIGVDILGHGERRTLEIFAAQATAALTLVLRQVQQAQISAQLEQALNSRTVIDQALGVLMAQQRCSAEEAFALLRAHSQHTNRKLRDVAAELIARVSGGPAAPGPTFRRPPST